MKDLTIPTTFKIGGEEFQRIRYGNDQNDWEAKRQPCHDCYSPKGDLHVFGCDLELCPRCGGQAIYCDCPCDDRSIKEPRTMT